MEYLTKNGLTKTTYNVLINNNVLFPTNVWLNPKCQHFQLYAVGAAI